MTTSVEPSISPFKVILLACFLDLDVTLRITFTVFFMERVAGGGGGGGLWLYAIMGITD